MEIPLIGLHILRDKRLAELLSEAREKGKSEVRKTTNRQMIKLLNDNLRLTEDNLSMAKKLGIRIGRVRRQETGCKGTKGQRCKGTK